MKGQKGMENRPVTISDVVVQQTGKLDPSTTRGLGFFGSISSQIDESEFGHSKGTTVVENIRLRNVSINNESTEVKPADINLVRILLGTVGGLLGIVGGILDVVLPGNLQLENVLKSLLEVQQKRPDIFATGSFAGRITGDVKVMNCSVENASVSNVKNMTGGFAGYTEGIEKYDGLSKILGTTVNILSKLLNILPCVGLGDLITVLLQNKVALGQLIPVGYYKPSIEGCSVVLSSGTVGTDMTDYNGGFIGMQIATNLKDCHVNNLNTVKAKVGAGGFAGVERDAVIKSLLSDLGVNLVSFDIKSKQENCTVNVTLSTANNLNISATGNYAGGFNGLMTNSSSTGCKVSKLKAISAEKYAGGFTRRATIGYGVTIGTDDEKTNSLLGEVSKLVSNLVKPENEDKLNTLLSLSGLTPSELHYCSVSGNDWTVQTVGDYAGGFIGQGDGAMISMVQKSSIGNQELICKGWFLPSNTYDCSSFVVNGTAVIGKESKYLNNG